MSDVIRSVLFVDFDNVFFSLQTADKAAAKRFADDPKRWLDAIESGSLIESLPGAPIDGRRRILMRRCYANPAVMRYFRSYFTRSGFQIVDCPPLTGRGKNSADIYMVVDILDALRHETRFDEFIILSGDADFTPVLLRLRAHDRLTSIYSNAVTAAAYKSLCDGMITEEGLIDLMSGDDDLEDVLPIPGPQAIAPVAAPNPAPVASTAARPVDRRRAAAKQPEPTDPLASAVLDAAGRPPRIAPEIAALARRVNAATNVPMLSSEAYAALFRTLAAEVRDGGFSFNRTVNTVIRKLNEAGYKVRPQYIAFVVKGLMLSGHEFAASDTPEALARGFRRQVLYLCASDDLALSAQERTAIGSWIIGGLRDVDAIDFASDEPIETNASLAAEVAGIDPAAEADADALERAIDDGIVASGEASADLSGGSAASA
jgi:hypothetical protein